MDMEETCQVYYKAESKAINNGRTYHLAAILKRNGRVVKVGENTSKTHPRFKRQYPDGTWGSHMHAEMNVLRFAEPGDEVEVIRFSKCDHTWTMAKPCVLCMSHLRNSGIKRVRYTNWDGEWEELEL
jgi:tRNA(Arg) A34 adenosine deaminase TadA